MGRLRAPCITQGRTCNNCGSQGHLARVCTTKTNLSTEVNGSQIKQREKMPTNRGYQGYGAKGAGAHTQGTHPIRGDTRFHCGLGGHNKWGSKPRKTRSLEHLENNDSQTAGEQLLLSGNNMTNWRASPHQEVTSRDRNIDGQKTVGDTVSQTLVGEAGQGNPDVRVQNNGVRYPPCELQTAGRYDFLQEPISAGVTRRWEMNPHHLDNFPGPAPIVGYSNLPPGTFDKQDGATDLCQR